MLAFKMKILSTFMILEILLIRGGERRTKGRRATVAMETVARGDSLMVEELKLNI